MMCLCLRSMDRRLMKGTCKEDWVRKVLQASAFTEACLRAQIWPGAFPRNHQPDCSCTVIIAVLSKTNKSTEVTSGTSYFMRGLQSAPQPLKMRDREEHGQE